jgi:uncharacterized protein
MLTSRYLPEIRALLDQDPIAHCFVESRVADAQGSHRFGGELWGWVVDGRLESMLYSGANLVPVATTPLARANFAERARQYGRRCSSIVGPADEVMDLWRLLGPAWGPARELRPVQHVMATALPPIVAPDPRARPLRMEELPLLVPAAVAMFTEEVGVSPQANGGGPAYRARLAELVRAGRSLGIVENGQLLFKAEIGAVTTRCCQVQGVWVAPEARGTGLGKSGMAAVVAHALDSVAPIVSLYVNDFNTRAVATYLKVGFRHVGTFATILF